MADPMTPDEIRAMNDRILANTRARLDDYKPGFLDRHITWMGRMDGRVARISKRVSGWSVLVLAVSVALLFVPIIGVLALLPLLASALTLILGIVFWVSAGLRSGPGGLDASDGWDLGGSDGGL